jgi:hypothetical protein
MNTLKVITLTNMLLCVLVFILTILDFAALHDIKRDYISQYILKYLEISPPRDLPNWTSTEGEWYIVSVSLYLRFLYFLLNMGILGYYYRKVISNKTGT